MVLHTSFAQLHSDRSSTFDQGSRDNLNDEKLNVVQADRNSLLSLFAVNSGRWGEIGIVLAGSLRAAAVLLHNQNMKSTVVKPNETHPNRNI